MQSCFIRSFARTKWTSFYKTLNSTHQKIQKFIDNESFKTRKMTLLKLRLKIFLNDYCIFVCACNNFIIIYICLENILRAADYSKET